MIVYQYDHAGLYCCPVKADPSPIEPGEYLIPGRCARIAPPDDVPGDKWPRWNGAAWELVTRPQPQVNDAVAKLQAFLAANPDVAEMINNDGGANV